MKWSGKPIPAWVARWGLTALGVGIALAYLRYAPDGMKPWQTQPGPVTIAQPPKEVVKWHVKTVEVPGPQRIVFYQKPELAAALKMPELATSPDNVLATATIPRHAGSTTAIATLSPEGKGAIIYRQEPPKFLEVKKEFEARGRYLFTGVNLVEAEVVARPLRVGPVELEAGVGVEVRRQDSNLGLRSYVGASYRF